jgi:hypothetical protein
MFHSVSVPQGTLTLPLAGSFKVLCLVKTSSLAHYYVTFQTYIHLLNGLLQKVILHYHTCLRIHCYFKRDFLWRHGSFKEPLHLLKYSIPKKCYISSKECPIILKEYVTVFSGTLHFFKKIRFWRCILFPWKNALYVENTFYKIWFPSRTVVLSDLSRCLFGLKVVVSIYFVFVKSTSTTFLSLRVPMAHDWHTYAGWVNAQLEAWKLLGW